MRELERQLFHAERLTTVGRLAAGIAHEINNPLEGMANYLRLARDALARGDLDAAARAAWRACGRGSTARRSSCGRSWPMPTPRGRPQGRGGPNTVLAETTEFVRSRPEFAARPLRERTSPAAPLVVEGSAVMLGQVALNLILNACEAQPRGGEVRVDLARGRAAARWPRWRTAGPGIAAADRERGSSSRSSRPRTPPASASPICHSIVRQHGGDLRGRRRDGGGSVFRMSLPRLVARTEVA